MTNTDDERRRIARRMREQDIAEFRESAIVPFLECLGIGYENWRGVLDRLADLIDRPTCKNDSEFGSHTVTVGNYSQDECFDFVCSRCGIRLYKDEMGNSPLMDEELEHRALRYCPSCGAEVVK